MGLFRAEGDQTANKVGQRFAAALDQEAARPEALFGVTSGYEEAFGTDSKVRVVSVWHREADGAAQNVLFDIFELDFAQSFRREASRRRPILNALLLALMVLLILPKALLALTRGSKTIGHRLQAFYGMVILLLIVMYCGLLVDTSITAVRQASRVVRSSAQHEAPKPSKFAATAQAAVLTLTALGLLSRKSFKELLEAAGIEAAGALGYVAFRRGEGVLRGDLSQLIDHVFESPPRHGVKYRRLHIVSYSFGSIVARRWLNIFRQDDVLASDFTDASGAGSVDRPIIGRPAHDGTPIAVKPDSWRYGPAESFGLGGLLLAGFRAHGDYWSPGETHDYNVFNHIVKYV